MKLAEFIRPDLSIVLEGVESRDAFIHRVSEQFAEAIGGVDAEALAGALLEREEQGSTATPEGVALPHAMVEGLARTYVAVVLVKGGVEFRSNNVESIDVAFVIVGPRDTAWEHVRLLARIARICHAPGALGELRSANTADVLHERVIAEDGRHV